MGTLAPLPHHLLPLSSDEKQQDSAPSLPPTSHRPPTPPQDWLFISYKRVSGVEYSLLVGTLVAIMALGLEAGIAAGIVAAACHFAYR